VVGSVRGLAPRCATFPLVGLVLLALSLTPIQARATTSDEKLTGQLHSVSAVSSTEAWAAGYYLDAGTDTQRTLTEHWNGSSWSAIASPNVGSINNYLLGVSAVSASDAWAVGYDGQFNNLIEHWNGSSWSVVASPNVGFSIFYGVSAVSSTDVWAVGMANDLTLIEHWNGSAWSVVASPNRGTHTNSLSGVSALSGANAWAVGYRGGASDSVHTLIEHWNGTAWSVVASPSSGYEDFLNGVSASSGTNVWAVGSDDSQTLTEHWDGSAWSVVASPNVGSAGSVLSGVSALSGTNAWAVGASITDTGGQETLIEHWDGSTWSVAASPNVSESSNQLFGVDAVSGTQVWAVGDSYQGNLYSNGSLIEVWNGTAWRIGDDVHPPIVTMPVYKLVQPSRLSGSSPPTIAATIEWSGTDLDDAIASYQVQEQVNGGVWTDLSLSSPLATSVSTRLAIGSTDTFRVRATDSNGHTGSWATGPTDSIFGYQESAATYAGAWNHVSLSGAWGGSVDSTTAAGAAVSLSFAGDHVAWIGTIGPSYGSANVYIDGVLFKTVNCNASTTSTRQVLLKYGFGSVDTHTIKIVNVATPGHPRIDVDGFVSLG
jgi:hypothetical protein